MNFESLGAKSQEIKTSIDSEHIKEAPSGKISDINKNFDFLDKPLKFDVGKGEIAANNRLSDLDKPLNFVQEQECFAEKSGMIETKETNVPEKIKCKNEELEGKRHPETDVPFEKRQVKVGDQSYEVVVPQFDSVFDAQLPEDLLLESDAKQFKECNAQLKEVVANNKELREKFDDDQLEQIENGETPDGYSWHHDAETGKMQLVDTETHQKTGHTGGRAIWGGGTENR